MGLRRKLAFATFLAATFLTFVYSASIAGDTGKEPEDSIALLSLLVFIFASAAYVVSWLYATSHRRYSRHFSAYLSSAPLPDPNRVPPRILQSGESPSPVREDDLWPEGLMLCLDCGPNSKSPVFGNPIVILTKEALVIAGSGSDDRMPSQDELNGGFVTPDSGESFRVPTSDISRVLVAPQALEMLKIWVREPSGKERMILRSGMLTWPKSIRALIANATEETGERLSPYKKGLKTRLLLGKAIERQFKVAALNATIASKGATMSDEEFTRLMVAGVGKKQRDLETVSTQDLVREGSVRRIVGVDSKTEDGIMTLFMCLVLSAMLLLNGIRSSAIVRYALVSALMIGVPGALTISRILSVRGIVAHGNEVTAHVLGHKTVHGPWRGSRRARLRLSYEYQGQHLERSVSILLPEKIPLASHKRIVLLVDPRNCKRFVLRDLFVELRRD